MMYFFAALLGAAAGSFLNVVALRGDVSSMGGRSHCPKCNHTLAWYELIPVISYLCLKGRCSNCESVIPLRYVVIELVSAGMFAALFALMQNPIMALLYAVLLQVSIVLFIYDYTHLMLPNLLVNTSIFLAVIIRLVDVSNYKSLLHVVVSIALGVLVVAGPLWLMWFLSKGQWLGFGDVRYGVVMGALLGPSLGITSLILAYWIGAIIMLVVLAVQKIWKGGLHRKSLIPFGPFLITALWLVIFVKLDIMSIYLWIGNTLF